MSFLLDVADPSIHFHARQCCNSPSPSKPTTPTIVESATATSSNSKSTIAGRPISALTSRLGAIATNSSSNTATTTSSTSNGTSSSSNHLGVPTPSMFSTMSRMIRQVSASTTPLGSSPPSGTTTPDASSSHVSDPFNRVSAIGSALSSPWMKPSVCDDDHMNKLVSFQL
ncbi:hypothetical protein BGZ95_009696 [Linnemannia exigua]|uniref:Uncharacterized protein n=1 Tax=Linnemannia exigua TaxID=604196 RepID=A0AAD4DCQ1_9FUNG|nr:hypothetical protein BGZ95_009696 [Linnemannia exigua]